LLLGRLRNFSTTDLGLSALEAMLDTVRFRVDQDMDTQEGLSDELLLLGSKYRNFRGLSRETVREVKALALYFVRMLGRVREEAASGREGRLRRIEKVFGRLSLKLVPLQKRVTLCVDSYKEVAIELGGLAKRAQQLREDSEKIAGALAVATICAAFIAPAALLAEEALLAVGVGSAGLAGQRLKESYEGLGRFHTRFLATTRKVATKINDEQGRLQEVRLALEGASTDATVLEEDLQDADFELLADSAAEASGTFARLAERCEEFLGASELEQEPLLLGA